jgi:hypothetical protein
MLKKRIKSKNLWRMTSAIRRKRILANNKKKIFVRHRAFTHQHQAA